MKRLFYNGKIITADKANNICSAILTDDERIVFVGEYEEAVKISGGDAAKTDLCGCAVLPGFIDSHIHLAVAEANAAEEIGVSSKDGIKSVSELLERLKAAAKERKSCEWIVGSGYSQEELLERRHVTIEELDGVSLSNPIMLVHKSGHLSVCNSAAFKVAEDSGLMFPTEHTERDKNGTLTGLVKETAHFMMLQKSPLLPRDEALISGIEGFCRKLLTKGITSAHDAGGYGSATFRTLQKSAQGGTLGCRTYAMLWTLFGKEAQIANAKAQVKSGFYSGFGNDMLKKGPIKLMVDGSAVGGTCATSTPILGRKEAYPTTFTQSELDEIFTEAHRAGFQLTAHAVGDVAVEMVLNAYQKAMTAFPRKDPRHRIEHCFLCPRRLMARIKEMGIIPVSNPAFLAVWGDVLGKYYGDREDMLMPLKDFESFGIITPFGSDAMVIDEYSPLFGIAAAMERKALESGRVLGAGQKISLMRAVKAYTIFGAYASFEEKTKGSLEAGKLADLVVLSNSITGKSPSELRKIKVEEVYVGGKRVKKGLTLR